MDKLVLLAPIVTTLLLVYKGFAKTYVYWFVPLLLQIPYYLSMDGPGIPPLSFATAGFIPFLFTVRFYESLIKHFHWMDVLIYIFILMVFLSEQFGNGFSSSRQAVFIQILSFWGPYIAARSVIVEDRMEKELGRVFIICMALIAIYSLYTFRFGINHYLIIRARWPFTEALPGLAVWPRWGFFRASGPFMHPIMTGMAYGFAIPTAIWLLRSKAFKTWILELGFLGASCIGLLTTMSRGPFIGAFAAFALYITGENKFRKVWFGSALFITILISPIVTWKGAEYFNASRATASSSEQETVMYRRDLIINYTEVIMEKPLLGYSFMRVPVIGDQTSIDNGYILYALQWGLIAVSCVVLLMFSSILAMVYLGVKEGISLYDRGLAWSICGAITGCAISVATVALMQPVTTILIIYVAWASGLMVRHRQGTFATTDQEIETPVETAKTPERKMVIL